MSSFFAKIRQVCEIIVARFIDDRLPYASSALTFTTLLAVVPLLAVSISFFSAFSAFHSVRDQVQQFIIQNFIPAAGDAIQSYLQGFIAQAGKLSALGTIFLIVTAITMMLTIERSLNDIWGVSRRKLGIYGWARYWAILSLAPIFIGLSVVATSYVISLPFVVGTVTTLGVKTLFFKSIPFVLTVLVFWLLYVAVPNCRVPWRHGFIGAVIATSLFELFKKGFVFYVAHFATYNVIYGAIAVVPIFLLWIYMLWVIILFGALVSNVLATHDFTAKVGKIDGFTHAFLWLGGLWQAQKEGKGLSLKQLYTSLPGHYQIDANELLGTLESANLIQSMSGEKYMLSRDFSSTTLAELYEILPWKLPAVKKNSVFTPKMKKALTKAADSLQKRLNVPLSELY